MAARAGAAAQNMKTELDVCLGKVGTSVGKLVFVRNGPRVLTRFAYFQDRLDNKDTFNFSRMGALRLRTWQGDSQGFGLSARQGTSLRGMRPKCSILDEDGFLALGKFPSIKDERNVKGAEVLALKLASLAGL